MIEFINAFVLEVVVESLGPQNDRDRRVLRLYVEGLVWGAVEMGVA